MDFEQTEFFTFEDLEFYIHWKSLKTSCPIVKDHNPELGTKQLNSSIANQNGNRARQSYASIVFGTSNREEIKKEVQPEKPHTQYGLPSRETVNGVFSKTYSFSKEQVHRTYNGVKNGGTSIYTYVSSPNKKTEEISTSNQISNHQLQQTMNAVLDGGFALYKLCLKYTISTECMQKRLSDIMNGSFALYRTISNPHVPTEIIHERFNDVKHAAFSMFEIISNNQQKFYIRDRYNSITDSGFAIYQMTTNRSFDSRKFFQLIKGGCTLYEMCFNKTLFAAHSLNQYYNTITNAEFIVSQYRWYTRQGFSKEELLKYDHVMGTGLVLINVLAIPYPDMVTVAILMKSADVLYRTFSNGKVPKS